MRRPLRRYRSKSWRNETLVLAISNKRSLFLFGKSGDFLPYILDGVANLLVCCQKMLIFANRFYFTDKILKQIIGDGKNEDSVCYPRDVAFPRIK